jgi:hypothetical protein
MRADPPAPGEKGGSGIGNTKIGTGSNVMVVADGHGWPIGMYVASAQPPECQLLEASLATVRVPQVQLQGTQGGPGIMALFGTDAGSGAPAGGDPLVGRGHRDAGGTGLPGAGACRCLGRARRSSSSGPETRRRASRMSAWTVRSPIDNGCIGAPGACNE